MEAPFKEERFLIQRGAWHGLRIIEWSREGAKLMEKVVPFIRGETRQGCQEGKNIGDAMMTVEIESESDVLAKTRGWRSGGNTEIC